MTNFDNKIDNVGSLLSIVDPGPNISISETEIRSKYFKGKTFFGRIGLKVWGLLGACCGSLWEILDLFRDPGDLGQVEVPK